MKSKTISIYLIFLIIISVPAFANAEQVGPVDIKQVRLQDIGKNIASPSRHLSITLSENVGVGSNDNSPSDQQNISQNNKMINLSDQVIVNSNDHNRNLILVTPSDSIVTTLDRISNSERIRINGKTITVDNKITDEQTNKISSFINGKTPIFTNINNFENNDLLSLVSSNTHLFAYVPTGISFDGFGLLHNAIIEINHFTSENKDPLVILLFIPITGYVLTRLAGNKIQTKSRQILSFCLFALLISSMVVTPLSISPTFLANAYAESSNQNNTNTTITNSSIIPVFSSSNATQIGPVFSSSNATNLSPVFSSSNATQIGPVFSSSNATNLTQPMQNLTQSWNFTSLNGKVGHVTAVNNTLQLQGTGYLAQKINATNNIQQLTLSAWVKPDYSQGSPQFTIISKENTFMLTINNNIPPTKIATFSVFDGIRWQTVQSTSVIPEQWTHIAATFDPSSISIYVNGTKESTVPVSGISSIAINGKIMNKTIDQLSSDADVVIGADIDTTRQSSSSQFSGLIKDVSMYNSVLSGSQIQQLYASGQGILGTNLIPVQTNLTSTNDIITTNATSPVSFSESNSTNLSAIVYANDTLTAMVNATNSTDMPIVPSMNTTKQSYLLTESPEFNFQYYSDAAVKKSGKLLTSFNGTGQSNSTIQSNGWRSSHESIAFKITAPDGNQITLKTTVKKIRDGKFDITLSSLKSAKPGVYTITAILTKNGKTYTTTDQYMWGLVSLNTQKSIYKPGEVANFTIVVLDNQGHSVCNSNIVMNIHSPTSSITTLSSGNGITPGDQCGLYNAQYVPQLEGNYTIDMAAQNPSGIASFSTSFLAQNNFAFDIVRTAQSKIDPVNNPNSFNVKLDVSSYTNATSANIQETVPSVFNVTTDGTVQTVGNVTTISWNKSLIGNATSVQYSYSVPLEFPRLYALGPAKISYGTNSSFTEARPWFVANDPSVAKLYLHVATSPDAPTNGEKSTALPVGTFKGNSGTGFEDLSMSSLIGTTQTTKSIAGLAQTGHQDNYIARFTSPPLAAQTIAAGTWTFAVQTLETNAGANSMLAGSLYVWRPSTSSVVGYVYDSDTALGAEWGTTTKGVLVTVSGSAVAAKDGDVLVFEVWRHAATQTAATSWAQELLFDGTTDVTNGGTAASAASYIQAPNNLVFEFTKLYLHAATTTNAPTNGEQSTAMPVGTFKGNSGTGFENLSMSSLIGTSQTSKSVTSLAQTAAQDNYIARFTSPPLANQTIPAGTWTLALQSLETNANANSFFQASLYVWRPSTSSVVGYVYDSSTALGTEWGTATTGRVVTVSGNSVDAQAGDVLVLEVWRSGTQAAATAYAQTLFFDGTTDVTNGGTAASAASFIQFNTALEFGNNMTETVTASDLLTHSENIKRTLTETVTAHDSAGKTVMKTLTETVTAHDTVSTAKAGQATLTETVTASDSLSTTASRKTTLTETVTAHDSAGKSVNESLIDSPIAHDILLTSASHSAQVTSILVDNTQTITGNGTSVTLPSFVVSNGANRYLLVAIETNGTSVSSVTYGAQSLSLIKSSNDLNSINAEIWGVANPASGTADVVVNFSHTAIAVVGAYNILGVDQSNPIPTTAAVTGGVGGGSPSVFITNQYVSSMVIDSAAKQTQTISTTAPQSQTWSLQSGGVTGGSSTILPYVTVSNHFLWTPGASTGRWAEAAVELKASGLTTPSEIIHVSDTLITSSSKSKTLTETVTVSDHTVSVSGGRSKTLTETVTASDTLSTVGTKMTVLIETVTSADQAGMSGGRSHTFTETVTVSDLISTASSKKTTLVETVTAHDSLTTAASRNATLTETVTASDALSTSSAKKSTLSETVTASDSLTTAVTKKTTLTETVTAHDSLTTAASRKATLSETVTASDSLSTAASRKAMLSETVTAHDSLSTAASRKAMLTETVTAHDSLSSAASRKTTLTETVTASDVLTTAASRKTTLSETVTASDSLTTAASRKSTLTETVTASDSLSTAVTKKTTLSETVTTSDVLTTAASRKTTLTETVTASDSLTTAASRKTTLTETVTASDSLSTAASRKTTLSETVTASDTSSTAASRKAMLTETITASDSLSTAASRKSTLSETVTASDTSSTAASRKTTLTETVTASDSLTTAASRKATLTETVTASDSLTTAAARNATLTETVTTSDALSTSSAKKTTLTETVAASDSLSTAASRKTTLTETVTASDASSTAASRKATLTEAVTASDSLTTAASRKTTLTETITASDLLSTAASRNATLTETVTTSDVSSTAASRNAVLSETVTASDSLTTAASRNAVLSETVTASDNLTTAASRNATLTETVTAHDDLTTAAARNTTLTETVTASDSLSTAVSKNATLIETVTASDTSSTAASRNTTLSETVTASDSLITAASRNATLTETVTASDSLTTAASRNTTISETVTASDSLTTAASRNAILSETVTTSDTLSTSSAKNTTLSETVTASDASSTAASRNTTLSETVTASDSLSTAVSKNATLTETVTASDASSTAASRNTVLDETVTASDASSTAASRNTVLDETVTASDTSSTSSTKNATLTETVTASDASSTSASLNAALTETVTTSDSLATAGTKNATLTELVTASDASSTSSAKNATLTELVTASDSLTTAGTKNATLTELVTASDNLATAGTKNTTITETVTTSDSLTTAGTKNATLTEVVTASDNLTTAGTKNATLTETVTTSDSLATAGTKNATLTELVTASDASSTSSAKNVTLTELVTASDTSSTLSAKNATLTETVTTSDTSSTSASLNAALTETVTTSDSLTTAGTKNATLTEVVTASDNLTTAGTKNATLTELVTASDTSSTSSAKNATLAETVTASDTSSTEESKSITLTELVTASDTSSTSASLNAALTELVTASDTSSTSSAKNATLIEVVTTSDVSSTAGTKNATLTELVTTSDSLTTAGTKNATLTETVTASDASSTKESKSITLTELVTASDSLTTAGTKNATLAETVTASDTSSTSSAKNATLTETVTANDSLSTTGSKNATLTETVTTSDASSTATSRKATLTELVTASDSLITAGTKSVTLLETVTAHDTVSTSGTKNATLTETVTASDTSSTKTSRKTTLTETVTASDLVSTTAAKKAILSETVTAHDSVSNTGSKSRTLTETVTAHDSLTTAASRKATLTETVTASDVSSTAIAKSTTLTETVTASDNLSSGLTKNLTLTETVSSHDSISFKGGVKIEARDQDNNLITGAIYSISPNPNGGNIPEVIVDGGSNDNDAQNNGRAVVTLVPFGPYNITMTTIPTGFNVLGNSTIYTVYNTNLNGTSIFRLTPINYNISTLPPTVITSAPNLNATTLGMWSPSGFNAVKINGTTQTPITEVQSLPPIISVGSNNTGLNSAISNQVTVSLKTSFADSTTPTTIMNALGVPVYSMPQSSNVTAVLPSIVGTTSTTSTNQVITTPPLNQIIPGQKMIIPVETSVIPQTGGLKQLNVTACADPGQNGCDAYTPSSSNDWFLVKTDNQLPASKPVLPLNDKLTLYVNVTYQHEVTGTGFDWSNPANFKTPPQLTLQLPKNAPGVELDSNKCPISDIFLFDPTGNGGAGSWITNPVTILSAVPSADNSLTCDVVVSAPHFSQFALGGHGISSTTPGSTVSTPGSVGTVGGAGGGATGVGTSSAAAATTSNGGGAGPYLKIQDVSYDICDKQIVRIQVATDYNKTDPTVIVRTSINGVVDAKLIPVQPYAEENVNASVRKLVYEASINPKETSFEVVALETIGTNLFSVGKTVEVTGCNEDLDFTKIELLTQPAEIDLSAPQIFDLKFQVGNGTEQLASEPTTQFVRGNPLSVYAIVNTPTPITTSELRFSSIENNDSAQFHTVTMNVTPLQVSNSTYLLSATVPSELLEAPGIQYWIHVENSANKNTDSDVATIGVKPNYPINATLELDVSQNRAAGTTARPSSYLTVDGGSVYGTISLVVDGQTVYTSPGQLFSNGQTQVRLEWQTQPTDALINHKIEAVANIYDKSFTAQGNIITFSSIKVAPISQSINIAPINDASGHTIANPEVLYSSFNNEGTMRYKVTAPDGTCVIGVSSQCLVQNSTLDAPGQIKSVTIGDQIYRVRYTGVNDTLERFSITSVDPIVGTWNVEIDSQIDLTPQTQMMDSTSLKVTYRPVEIPFLSE